MNRKIGKVIEVFIPSEDRNNGLLDVMDAKKIGFKIEVLGEVIEIIQKQDENNANIMRDDLVVVTRQVVSGREFVDIELYEGDVDADE